MPDTTTQLLEAPAANGADATLTSRQQQLRDEFAASVSEKRLYKRFPARGGVLAAKYKIVAMETINKARRQDDEIAANSDLLIGGLERILRYDPEHHDANERGLVDLEKWLEADLGGPLKLDNRLAHETGLAPGSAREILLALFEGNEAALCKQADDYIEWIFDTTAEGYQDFGLSS